MERLALGFLPFPPPSDAACFARTPGAPSLAGRFWSPFLPNCEEFAVKKCPLIPLGDRVVIVPEAPERRSKGGLFLLEDAPGTTFFGEAVAVGLGSENGPPEGSRVVYERFRGLRVEIAEREWVLVRESEVLAVVPV